MLQFLLNTALILTISYGSNHHKNQHKDKKSIHFPQSHVVQKGRHYPNIEGGFKASSLCTSHFCYDSVRDETCDTTNTNCVASPSENWNSLGKEKRKLQEEEACTDTPGCACLEAVDGTDHCLVETSCEETAVECDSTSDCSAGQICASSCCGYNQCLDLCCERATEKPTTTATTTADPTTADPTTADPTTAEPTTAEPTTSEPTTADPTTAEPTTADPTTAEPTTADPTTADPTTAEPTPEPTPEYEETPEPTPEYEETPEPTPEYEGTPEPTPEQEYERTLEPTPYHETIPEPTHETRQSLLNKYNGGKRSHSIRKHEGGDDDKPDIAPPDMVIEQSPQRAEEDGVEPPPAVQDDLLNRLKSKSGELKPIAGSPPKAEQDIEQSPQKADEDGVEPPPAVEEEPSFSVSKKKKKT